MTSKLLDAALSLAPQRSLDVSTLRRDQHLRSTLVNMVPDPEAHADNDQRFYKGLSLGFDLALRTLRAEASPSPHIVHHIHVFEYAKCMADAGQLLTGGTLA